MSRGLWKDYFSFTKKERVAVTVLLVIIAVFIILPYFFSPTFNKPVVEAVLQEQLTGLESSTQNRNATTTNNVDSSGESSFEIPAGNNRTGASRLFYFDPNTLNANGWKQLGVRDKTIQTILNYRNKGGRFNTAEDLKKIYGLKKEEAEALIPYVHIPSTPNQITANEIVSTKEIKLTKAPKKIDINVATAEEWKALPGIGEVLSNRIVKFRNAIHGFRSVEDIKRTYGLPDSTYQLIVPYLTITDSSSLKN